MIEAGNIYTATNPQKRTANNGNPFTFFTVEDIAHKGKSSMKIWWKIMCFQEIDIAEGDQVKINKIVSVNAAPYNGKLWYTVVADAKVMQQEDTEEAMIPDEIEDFGDFDGEIPPF